MPGTCSFDKHSEDDNDIDCDPEEAAIIVEIEVEIPARSNSNDETKGLLEGIGSVQIQYIEPGLTNETLKSKQTIGEQKSGSGDKSFRPSRFSGRPPRNN